METTSRLGLPMLIAGQLEKEAFHNEALTIADLLICGSVEGVPIAVPPQDPVPGCLYRVASDASGAFAGQAGSLAGWCAGGWRFVVPVEGMRLTDRAIGVELAYRAGAWTSGSMRVGEVLVDGLKVVGVREAAIAEPAGGSVVDGQSRTAVNEILAALRAHGLIASA